MKTKLNLLFILTLTFCAGSLRAAVTWWDPEGNWGTYRTYTGAIPLSDSWESSKWSTSDTGASGQVAWIEGNAAGFAVGAGATNNGVGTSTTAFTVTMNANHNIAGAFNGALNPDSCIVTVAGTGQWKLANGQGFDMLNSSDGSLGQIIINVPIVDGSYASATTGQLVTEGNGQIYLNGANTYSGGNFGIGTGGTLLGYSGASWSGIVNFNSNQSFGGGNIVVIRGNQAAFGALVAEGSSAISIGNGVDWSQSTTNKPWLNMVGNAAGVTFTGGWTLGGNQCNVGSGGSGNLITISGPISGSGGTLVKFNPSTLALSGANTYTGGTTVSNGVLTVNSIADSGNSALANSGTCTLAGGTLQYTGAGAATTTRQFSGFGTTGSTLDLPAGNLTLAGRTTGSAAFVIAKTSAGTLTLGSNSSSDGDNSFCGLNVNGGTVIVNKASTTGVHGIGNTTTVNNGGTLQVAGSGPFQIFSGVTVTVASGGIFDINGQTNFFTSLTLNGNGSGSGALINSAAATTASIACTAATGFPLGADSTIGGAGNLILAGVIGGAHALTKAGSGTLLLGNVTHTYSGATTINAGELSGLVGGSASSTAVTANGPAILGVFVNDNTKQFTWSSYTSGTGNPGLDFNFSSVAPSTIVAPLNISGAANFSGSENVTIEGGAFPAGAGTYPLMAWTSTSGTAPTTATLPGHVTGNLSVSGNTLVLNVTGNTGPMEWAVSGTGAWDINTSLNWLDNTMTASKYLDGDAVLLDDSAITTSPTISLNTTVAPGLVKANNSTYNYTISGTGSIGGTGSLVKQGSGTLTLATANAYLGGSTISAGTLQLGDGASNNGSVVGNIVDSANLTFANPSAQTYSGVISGGGTLTVSGPGTETLNAVQTFSGALTVSGGGLTIGASGLLGSGTYAANISNSGNLTFAPVAAQTLSGPIANSGTLTFAAGAGPTVSGAISGNGTLVENGPATLTLSAVNTYSGPTTIASGATLTVSGTGSLGSGAYAANITDNGTFNYTSSAAEALSGTISGSGALTLNNASAVMTLSGPNTFSGRVTVTAGTLSVNTIADSVSSALGFGPLTLSGGKLTYTGGANVTTTRAGTISGTASIVDLPAGNLEFNSAVTSGTIHKSSAGTLTLSGSTDNASLGVTVDGGKVVLNKASASAVHALGATTTVNNGGTLQLSGSGGDQIFSGVNVTVASGGVFDVNGKSEGMTTLTMGGTGSGSGALINSSATAATLTETATATTAGYPLSAATTIGGIGSITLAGAKISGAFSLTYSGSATLTLSSTNQYSGGTFINGGIVKVNAAETAGTQGPLGASGTISFGGGQLQYTATDTADYSGRFSTAGSQPISIDVNGQTVTFATALQGVGTSLTLANSTGSGTLKLTAANTYTGATTVNSGTLSVSSAGSIAGSSPVTVNGGTLALTNSKTIGGTLTVGAGGTLSTVDSAIGTITCSGNVGLSGATKMELSKTVASADQIASSGTITLGGTLNVANLAGTLALGDTFTLFSGTLAGSFSSTTLPATPTGTTWDTSQLSAGGNGTIKVVCSGTLAASAGPNKTVACPGNSVAIGGSPTATGGSGTYTYSWSPGTGLSSTTVANPTASPNVTTTYTVTVTDSLGCTTPTSSMTVTVTAAAPSITTQPANQSACVGSTATFSVTATGSGLSYSWAKHNNGGWGSAWSVTGGGSTFRASSTDNDFGDPACTSFTSAFDINSPSGNALGMWGGFSGDEVAVRTFSALSAGQVVSIDFDNGNVDNGSKVGFSLQTSAPADVLQFYFLGGQSNYKYNDGTEHDTGIPFQRQGLRVQFVLNSATAYTLLVTPCGGSATQFMGTYSGTIAQLKLFSQNNTGGNDKNIYFNNLLVGGYSDNADNYSGDFSGQDKGDQPISVGNGGSSYTTPALTTGDNGAKYDVTVYGCGGSVLSSAATLTVLQPTVSVNSGSICTGGSTNLTATTSASSPSYLWSPGGATTATITVSPSSTTTYSCLVTDTSTGCTNSASGTVTVNPLPTVNVNSAAICPGGSAVLTATTSASSPSYLWSPGGATTASIPVSPSSTTTYTCTVTDGTTTCANSGSGMVTVYAAPAASAGPNESACSGSGVSIGGSPTASGGTAPYTYSWTPTTGLSDATAANPTATITSTTTYTVVVTDNNSCKATNSMVLTVIPQPFIDPTPTVAFPDVTLTWSSLAGTTYRVQYTTAFNPAAWTDLTPDVPAAGSTATYTDTGAADSQRFYRVRVICP
ncbi:MAG: hypothetical protein C5B50_23310 [Verrucomicrobia bacterium]|nr:MAG: hypothetical protein C5B50_23310 [Verrucomicrobiota bacterium]